MSVRIILFCALFILGIVGPVWLFVPMLALYVGIYTSFEVLLVTCIVDAYFGYGATVPGLYTLCTGLGILVVHMLRPHLSVYNR